MTRVRSAGAHLKMQYEYLKRLKTELSYYVTLDERKSLLTMKRGKSETTRELALATSYPTLLIPGPPTARTGLQQPPIQGLLPCHPRTRSHYANLKILPMHDGMPSMRHRTTTRRFGRTRRKRRFHVGQSSRAMALGQSDTAPTRSNKDQEPST